MVEHIFKRHVTLRPIPTPTTLKAPEQRVLGDSPDWEEAGTEIRQGGESASPSALPPFLQAMTRWKLEGTTRDGAPPSRDEEVRSQDPPGT